MMGLAFMLQCPFLRLGLFGSAYLLPLHHRTIIVKYLSEERKDGDARTEIGGGSAGNATPKSAGGISRGNVSTERGAVSEKAWGNGKAVEFVVSKMPRYGLRMNYMSESIQFRGVQQRASLRLRVDVLPPSRIATAAF